jgi:diguanylate cyclase (GGDEF)-like protein
MARLGDAAGRPLGYALIDLDRAHSNAGNSMAISITRPLLACLASQLRLERDAVAVPTAPKVTGGPRLDFLLGLSDLDLSSEGAIDDLLERCVDELDCLSAVFCMPSADLTVTADRVSDEAMRTRLEGTRKHLLAWARLNNRPMVANRIDNEKAPFKILSFPVADRQAIPKGLFVLFRDAAMADFELEDVRLIEFIAGQTMTLVAERSDSMSGLMSHAAFERYLDQRLGDPAHDSEGTLLFVDIDELKDINASFEFGVGDQAIQRAAELIRQSLSAGEAACRLAAGSFVIHLPGRSQDTARRRGAELAEAAQAEEFSSAGRAVPFSLSYGVAPAPSGEARHWIAAAETACHEGRART